MARPINQREALFIAHYSSQASPGFDNCSISAKLAGYSEKSAANIGWQLLQRPKIKLEIQKILEQKIAPLSKEVFVQKAMKDYEELDSTEPNKPRFLQLAGQGAGIIGNNEQKTTNQTVNLTQINISGTETKEQLWDMTRKLLGND